MRQHAFFGMVRRSLTLFAVLLLAVGLTSPTKGANAADVPSPTGRAEDTNSTAEVRAYLDLQQQLHETQLEVERNRKEAAESSAQNTEALAGRLKTIEQSLSVQRAKELETMQGSNRVMLIVAGSFAAIGFVAMLLMGYFQWRTVHRLAELSALLPALPAGSLGLQGRRQLALGSGGAEVLATVPGSVAIAPEKVNGPLLETIERLEKRVRELEASGRGSPVTGMDAQEDENAEKPAHLGHSKEQGAKGFVNVVDGPAQGGIEAEVLEAETEHRGTAESDAGVNGVNGSHEGGVPSPSAMINSLLGKGQALLNMDKTDEAMACFEEALEIDDHHPEALVKKGTALEKMRKFNEAIECYDKAIEADSTMTIAYLYKGGLFNRMERFTEALACYEKALQTQEERGA